LDFKQGTSGFAEPVVDYAFKGTQVANLVTELLTLVYGAKEDEEFRFTLM